MATHILGHAELGWGMQDGCGFATILEQLQRYIDLVYDRCDAYGKSSPYASPMNSATRFAE